MKSKFLLASILIAISLVQIGQCVNTIAQEEMKILDQILDPSRYDVRVRPAGANGTSDGPVIITSNMFVRNIDNIDDIAMDFNTQITFRHQWNDDRLKFNSADGRIKYISMTDMDKIWIPDTFFRNEKHGHFHSIIKPNVLIRIYPNGDVLYSIRLSLTSYCPMNVCYYPADKQICAISFSSYAFTANHLTYVWKTDDPVQITKNLHLPQFTLQEVRTFDCTTKTNTGSYSCLGVDFLFKREFRYYLIQVFIPCKMMVILAYISFFIDPTKHHTSRMILTLVTLVVMSAVISFLNTRMPPVSYTKAMDVWTGVCLTFVFSALVEFAAITFLANRKDNGNEDGYNQVASSNEEEVEKTLVKGGGGRGDRIREAIRRKNWDALARIVYPIAFALFVVVYSAWLWARA